MTDKTKKVVVREQSLAILLLLISIILGGCSKAEYGPRQTLEKYSKARFSGDYDKAYSYLSKAKQLTMSKADFKQEAESELGTRPQEKLINSHCKYEVVKVLINGNKAIIFTDFVVPNVLAIRPTSMFLGNNLDPIAGMEKSLEEFVNQRNLPMVKPGISFDFSLVLEGGEWKISDITQRANPDSMSPAIKNMIKRHESLAKDLMKSAEEMSKKYNW